MAKRFDHVLNAIPELRRRTFVALAHMVAVMAKDEKNKFKRIKSAVMFTKDGKSTVKISRMHYPTNSKVTLVVTLGKPAFKDTIKAAGPAGIIIRYQNKRNSK